MNTQTPPAFLERVSQMDWFLITVSFIGALILYIIAKNNDKAPFSLVKVFKDDTAGETHWGVVILDMIAISLLGALAAYLITSPTTPAQAITGGLGYIGIINSISKQD
jgi:hypothetical protein